MIERMFKWLVCTRQPLHVDELREGIAFTLDDTQQDQDKIITDLNRLVRACSNLVIIDAETKVVQLSHYTVEQYLLQPAGSKFQFTRLEADIMAGEFCVAYLSFADFETRITPYKENVNTDLVALGKLASHPTLMAPDHPGHTVVRIWHSLRNSAPAAASIDMTKILRKSPPSQELSQYRCLPYTIKHWIRHSSHFLSENVDGDFRVRRRRKLFHDLVLEKNLPFQFRPWEDCVPVDKDLVPEAILGWGLMENHLALIELALGEAAHLPYNSPGSDKLAFFHSNIQKAWVDLFARNRLDTIVDKEIAIADDTIEEFPACSYTIGSPIHSWIFYRLLSACRKGHLEAVKACMLHRYAADGNRDAISYLIVVAATHGHLSLLEELWPYCGQTAISLKAKIGHNGICLNALECAIVSGHDAIVNFLHVAGCKIALFNDNESFFGLLDKAAYQMDIELLDTLFLLGLTALTKDTISHDSRVLNTLVKAVEKDHHTVVEAMLRHGANPDVPAKSGMTPIFHSILRSSIASLKVLLSYNASTGVTSLGLPLTLAASIGNPDIVEVLLSYNADMNVDVPRDGGFLPSVYQGYDPEMPFSLWKDYLCPTPLYVACYHGHLAVSRMLQEHGASPYLASPKFSTWISRQNHETVCKTRLYHLAIDRPLEAFQTPRLGDYPLWETPLDAALSRGHGSMFRTLTSTTENDPVVPEHDFAEDEIDPTSLLVHRQHNLHPWIEEALSNISSKSCSDPTANLEVLLAAGVDLRAVRLGDQPLIFWALENHPMCLKALPDARAYWADIPVHAFQELARLDILHTSRISSFMLGIAKYLALALRESPSYVRGILRDVFIYIVYSTNHTCEDTLIANSIIQAIGSCRRTADGHVRFKSPNTDQKTERLSGYEIEAIKSAYGHDNTPQGIDMLNELFDSLCSEGSEFEHFTNHFPPLFAAIKHQKDDLVREWYSSRDSAFFRGYRQRCSNLVFAIKAGSTLSILTFVLEEESKLGICCDTDDLGKTAFDKAWAAKDTTAVDLLKSWHGNGSWEEGDLWCCKFRRNRVVS
ncbi:ankyrin [Acephala macrosclerotiorum]|nr:ankyrin [Acephala macrosclerotiorum]